MTVSERGTRRFVYTSLSLRLGIALCLAVCGAYLLLGALTVDRRGGVAAYVATSDLLSNLGAGAIVLEGQPQHLYDRTTQATAQAHILNEAGLALYQPLPFVHLPFEALFLAALEATGLGTVPIFALWTLLSLIAIAGSLLALQRGWPLRGRGGLLAVLAACSFYPVFVTLVLGQSSALLLLAWATGSLALRERQDGWAGAALALAAIKPQAVPVLLLVLLIMRRWRTLATFSATLGGALVALLPVLGWDWPLRYARLALSVGGYPPDPTLGPASMQNWRGLVARLLGDSPDTILLAGILSLLSLLLVVLVWWRPGQAMRWEPGSAAWDRRWALTLLASLLITPYLLPHDLILALVPGWILAVPAATWRDPRWLAWLWIGWGAGLAAIFNSLPVVPAALWLAISVGALFRSAITPGAEPVGVSP